MYKEKRGNRSILIASIIFLFCFVLILSGKNTGITGFSVSALECIDLDADSICDDVDNCLDAYNPDQNDSDSDSIGDACDSCPADPANDADGDGICGDMDNCEGSFNPDQMDSDGDGAGDSCDPCFNDPNDDADGDGFCADSDNCPDAWNPEQWDSDADSIGDACDPCAGFSNTDSDTDGLCDENDNCPDSANSDQSDSDGDMFGDVCDVCSGISNMDVDGDHFCDESDNCADVSNPDQADSDSDGTGDLCDSDDWCGGDYGPCNCGKLVRGNVILDESKNCPEDGLTVIANNLTIDFNGYFISGDSSGPDDDYGLKIQGYNNTNIINGYIYGFTKGLYAENTYFTNISGGDYSYNGPDNDWSNDNNGYNIYLKNSDNFTIKDIAADAPSESTSGGSCPFLYAWNGSRYDFITDISYGGRLAIQSGSSYNVPRPVDYVKIEGSKLKQEDNVYKLRITQEYDEISYMDRLGLFAIDHSVNVDVYTSLIRAKTGTFYTTSKNPAAVSSCIDQDGHDCISKIAAIDEQYSVGNNDRTVLELNLGNLSNASSIMLILSAANMIDDALNNESGRFFTDRYLEVKGADGNWIDVAKGVDLLYPAAMPRTYAIDLTGKFPTDDYTIKISYAGPVAFDYVAVDTMPQETINQTRIDPQAADLHFRGYSEFNDDFIKLPYYYNTTNTSLFSNPAGNFTKFGDVLYLVSKLDDKFVIMHHGDEISLEFNYTSVPEGKARDFFLYSWDYYKPDQAINGHEVEPLPFRNMSTYPYPSNESYPTNVEYDAYRTEWNTRVMNNTGHNSKYGIFLENSDYGTIDDVEATTDENNNAYGIYLQNSTENVINNSYVGWFDYGIYLQNCNGNQILNSQFSDNYYNGIYLYNGFETSDNRIIGNTVTRNGDSCTGGSDESSCGGIALEQEDNCTIQDNDVYENYWNGISLVAAYDNYILSNNIYSNSHFGILVGGDTNTIDGNTLTNNNDVGIRITARENHITNNAIAGDGSFTGSWWGNNYGIELYNPANQANNNYFSNNNISGYYYGFYGDWVVNFTISDGDYFNNDVGIYLNNVGAAELFPVISNAEVYDDSETGFVLRSSSWTRIVDTNFNRNGVGRGYDGLYIDGSSTAYITNGDFKDNGNYGLQDSGVRSAYWTITKDVVCENNNILISDGWVLPIAGKINATNCEIQVEGEILDLAAGQSGSAKVTLDTTGTGQASVGGSDMGVGAEIYTAEDFSGTLTIKVYDENPGGSGFSLLPAGRWVDVTTSAPLNVSWWILKIYYTDDGIAGMDENSLRIEFYNDTSATWERYDAPNGGVNTVENYAWANLTHFSVFGVFGSLAPATITSTGGGSRTRYDCDDNKDNDGDDLIDLVDPGCSNRYDDDETDCYSDADCDYGYSCSLKKCVAVQIEPTCYDNMQNQDESDIDCGGVCKNCIEGMKCKSDDDCNFICDASTKKCSVTKLVIVPEIEVVEKDVPTIPVSVQSNVGGRAIAAKGSFTGLLALLLLLLGSYYYFNFRSASEQKANGENLGELRAYLKQEVESDPRLTRTRKELLKKGWPEEIVDDEIDKIIIA